MFFEAEFWVTVAFIIFLTVLGYFGVHHKILDALDKRAAHIRDEFDEAALVRQDAEALLRDAQHRQRNAAAEAAAVMELARSEARQLRTEARAKAEEFVKRRTLQAEARIGRAELQALASVRATAADAAAATASELLSTVLNGPAAGQLLARDIARLKDELSEGRPWSTPKHPY
jgi:F-type H+-transporting ATPase subunit b